MIFHKKFNNNNSDTALEKSENPDNINIEKSTVDEDSEKIENDAFEKTIDYFINQESELMRELNDDSVNKEKIRKKIMGKAKDNFSLYVRDKESVQRLMKRFENYMFGYYLIEPLIRDPEIQDITLYGYDRVRAERRGTWEPTGIVFKNKADYNRFIKSICTRNKASFSRINAQPKFTDSVNDPDYRLRFNVSSGFLNADGEDELHIRKIPKKKVLFDELIKQGYITQSQVEFLDRMIKEGKNVIFSGVNGSGKTYGLNAAIELLPLGKSGIIIQESDELFTDNPDFLCQHVVHANGESKISYGLKELSKIALMDARDIIILGEVKSGNDAATIPTITTTGSQVMMTSHGASAHDAIYKIADYIMQETGYEFTQCLRFLTNFIVVYCKKFKIREMSYVKNWDYEKNDLVIYDLDENGEIIKEEPKKSDNSGDLEKYILS